MAETTVARRKMGSRVPLLMAITIIFLGLAAFALNTLGNHTRSGEKVHASAPVNVQPKIDNHAPVVRVEPVMPSSSPLPQSWGLHSLDTAVNSAIAQHGNKFFEPKEEIMPLLTGLLNQIPASQVVDYQSFYILIKGLTVPPKEGIEIMRSRYIGKYYVLSGDAFTIQANDDYPEDGRNEFSLYGVMTLFNRSIQVPVNVDAVSTEKIPAYSRSPIIGKITGFELETSKGGFFVIVPQIRVVALGELSSCCESSEAVIINKY